MATEAQEAAAGAARQIAIYPPLLGSLAQRLRERPPAFVVTCARGSSDHAASYGKYLLETTVGRAVASIGPSVVSTYGRAPHLADALFVVVSQSGRSPDLLRLTEAAQRSGACVVGMVNDEASPLVEHCDVVLPLCAGDERSVAATKSFLLSCLSFLQLAAAWADEPALRDAVGRAPAALAAAAALDWAPALVSFAAATSLYTVGRGVGLAAALEIALKLKETCGLHGEAFSSAEILHGPVALVGTGFPILALAQHDRTEPSVRATIARLVEHGARVHATLVMDHVTRLPTVADVPAVLAPLCFVQSFYAAVPQLAAARGHDPDAPPHLAKVTRTV